MKTKPIALTSVLLAAAAIACWQLLGDEGQTQRKDVEVGNSAESSSRQNVLKSRFENLANTSVRWQVHVDKLRALDAATLGEHDIDILYTLLDHTPPAGQEENWWVVVNEIMEQMRIQAIAPERYTPELLVILRNPAASEVLRDYAVQHLGQWVTPRGKDLGYPYEQDENLVKETAETFESLVQDPTLANSSIPGTTLLVLVDMKEGGVSQEIIVPVIERLDPWFAAVLSGQISTGPLTRISAISAIAMLRLVEHRPSIRALAQSEDIDPSLRLNTIAALGLIGDTSDFATLDAIADSDSRFRYAALAARKTLKKNIQ